jgi:SMI1/KNR4 family protein SUKH-1
MVGFDEAAPPASEQAIWEVERELAEMATLYSPEGDADDDLRPGYLPIGEDDCGNLICLVVDDDPGAVYFWEHEIASADEAYTRLADSFEEFLGGLVSRADAYPEPPT